MSGLNWLSPAPEDFGSRVRSAAESGAFASLAAHDLSFQQLDQLGRRFRRNVGKDRAHDAITLGLLGSGTLDLLAPSIEASGLRHGLDIRVVTGEYGQPLQDAVDPRSGFNVAEPNAVLLSLDHRTLPFPKPNGSDDDTLSAARSQFNAIVQAIKARGVGVILVQTVPLLSESLFGHYDRQTELALNRRLRRWNDELSERCARDDALILLDAEDLASRVGREGWYNPVQWQMAKLPFDQQRVPLYAEHVARVLAAVRGRSRKCLVLDLDNTLWGGVIGDDGIEGIQLGNGSPEGEAFVAVQRAALALKERGVVLAICSKNEERTAKEPFQSHSEMVLGLDDIAVFIANWRPKSDNLREIARRLNIGTD
ncbi:MAG: HAD-IIIC family phosphatase, partial [Pseudomonadota bacterium]